MDDEIIARGADPQRRPKRRKRNPAPTASADNANDSRDSAAQGAAFPAVSAGEWLEAEQLRQWALQQLGTDALHSPAADSVDTHTLSLDLGGVAHLDAAVLQVLLAIRSALRPGGGRLLLQNPSPQLAQWFEFAGAADLLHPPPDHEAQEP